MSDASEMYEPKGEAVVIATRTADCHVCELPIVKGQAIVKYDDVWTHEGCGRFETEVDQELETRNQESGG